MLDIHCVAPFSSPPDAMMLCMIDSINTVLVIALAGRYQVIIVP
jgi:hypothetical protein